MNAGKLTFLIPDAPGGAPTLTPTPTPTPTMSACSRRALTLLSSVFAISGLGLLGLAVGTDYWLYLEEGAVTPLNQSIDIQTSLHSGLWRVCFLAGGWISWIRLRLQESVARVDVLHAERTRASNEMKVLQIITDDNYR